MKTSVSRPRAYLAFVTGLSLWAFTGCDNSPGGVAETSGGTMSAGGTQSTGGEHGSDGGPGSAGGTGAGGTQSMGGMRSTGGATGSGGTTATGGTSAVGGASAAGGTAAGGTTVASGGTVSAGGSATPTGGTSGTGGSSATGGTPAVGGSPGTGGGFATGGATGAGGSTTCTFPDPPSNVSAWIDESWNAQLGSNVKSRKDWLIDSIMMGKGQINLCVRWGASAAPSAAVKSGMAAAVQKWLTDWFSTLDGYGCFPYIAPVAKVTGWAVKPGNTAWVSDLDASIKVYTETDADGEPKCPDSCSFFTNWTHTFPNCPGGEAFHTDYWLWLDDSISGGAAAVGGDWGLRMPVGNFTNAMGKSNSVIEHEMGHGFGFQDYYDWTGSTPAGGSLMIVGSAQSQVPTTADQWLLRRAWKEMKTLRGW